MHDPETIPSTATTKDYDQWQKIARARGYVGPYTLHGSIAGEQFLYPQGSTAALWTCGAGTIFPPNYPPMPIQLGHELRRSSDPRAVFEPIAAIPWEIIAKHEKQAFENHSQSLERLRERGGLSACEAVAILEDRRWHPMKEEAAFFRLAQLIHATTVPA
jgi:hypothetical protein